MKKLLSVLLTLTLLLALSAPAFAAEDEPPDTTATVSTFEELQAAINAAHYDDTIAVSNTIYLFGTTLSTYKHLSLTVSDDFSQDCMFVLYNGATVAGFTFAGGKGDILVAGSLSPVYINNCIFTASGNISHILVKSGYGDAPNAYVQNCVFEGAEKSSIVIENGGNAEISNCSFRSNSTDAQGGAIHNDGVLLIFNSTITNNEAESGGGISSSGTLTISNCQVHSNISTNSGSGADVLSFGKLNITDGAQEEVGFFEETTGEKISLPISDYEDTAKLIYLTDEAATIRFAPATTGEEETEQEEEQVQPQEQEEQEDEEQALQQEEAQVNETQEQPSEEHEEENPVLETLPEELPAETPEDSPAEISEEISTEEQQTPIETETSNEMPTDSQIPEETPIEPQATEEVQIPAETEMPTEPEMPEESTDTDNTPPASPAPTYTPPTYSYSRPSGRSTTPTTTIEEEPAIKADAPALVFACGEAVIDRTRSVVLAGYDDGELHLDDTLTRAQMATIIYRLLDADTLAKFDTAESEFNDVSPNAWYSRYVSTIAKAGIVVGTGNGYYSPDGTLTWAQILTVLSRFVAPQAYTLQNIQYDGWAAEAIQTAAALGWIEDTADFAPNAVITRGEFVELVNGVLELNSTV